MDEEEIGGAWEPKRLLLKARSQSTIFELINSEEEGRDCIHNGEGEDQRRRKREVEAPKRKKMGRLRCRYHRCCRLLLLQGHCEID